MSLPGCPYPDDDCDVCKVTFMESDPGDLLAVSYHHCGCPYAVDTGEQVLCVGCGAARDLWAEWNRFWGGP